jgi:hypothetical protein
MSSLCQLVKKKAKTDPKDIVMFIKQSAYDMDAQLYDKMN